MFTFDLKLVARLFLPFLEHIVNGKLEPAVKRAADKAAVYLHAHDHDWVPQPGTPTDADKDAFAHRALYRTLHEMAPKAPGKLIDGVRDVFNDAVALAARPQLSAGMTTAQACEVVGAAFVKQAEALEAQLKV